MADRAWTWRHAIIKSSLPATTRHVLLTVSCFMNEVGGGCYPTQKQLAEATGLSDRAIRTQLDIAEAAGWIKRSEHGFKGQKWRNHEYEASWPEGAEAASAGQSQGAELPSSRTDEGAEAGSAKVRKDVPTTSPYTNPTAAAARDDIQVVSDKLFEAVGDKMHPHGGIVIGPILELIAQGVDLETDILPIIKARAARMTRPARSWSYFVEAIRDAHNQRVEAGKGLAQPKVAAVKRGDDMTADELRSTWEKRLNFARPRQEWISWLWGPMPGQPGCRVPSDLLQPRDGKHFDGTPWSDKKQEAA